MNFLTSGKTPRRTGNAHPNIQPQDVFACRDGDVALAVGNDGQFAKLCEVLGQPALAQDERFAKNAARVRNLEILRPLDRRTAQGAATAATGSQRSTPPAFRPDRSTRFPEVFEDPQVKHRGMRVDVPHPLPGTVPQVASPMRFAAAPLAHDRAPPLLGEHSAADPRASIGIDDAEIEQLRKSGVI